MPIKFDLSEKVFGRLKAICFFGIDKYRNSVYTCLCNCGKKVEVRGASLKNGLTKSCGCLKNELATIRLVNATKKHGMTDSRIYRCWQSMIRRCTNKNVCNFKNYGGRGIKVCEEWRNSTSFITWALANGYQDHLTIDRINNDGNYEPSNCRWATMKEQLNNRRSNVKLEANNHGVFI